jgi:prepilin-type N-terminal cleavage/methylation domain-containing protein
MGEKFKRAKNVAFRPYSLVEMLVVLAIIAILVGLGAGGYTVARRWLAQSQTEALLAKLKLAIESYKNDKGYYPLPSTDPDENDYEDIPNFRLDANANDFSGSASGDHLQPRNNMSYFMDYSKLRQDQSYKIKHSNYTEYFVKDGWNSPADGENFGAIKYRCPGEINKTSFDLRSAGPDRKYNTSDDIIN